MAMEEARWCFTKEVLKDFLRDEFYLARTSQTQTSLDAIKKVCTDRYEKYNALFGVDGLVCELYERVMSVELEV